MGTWQRRLIVLNFLSVSLCLRETPRLALAVQESAAGGSESRCTVSALERPTYANLRKLGLVNSAESA
jgi:hypothetical protein